MSALRALVTVGLALLILALILPLIFATPPIVYTGISRSSERAFGPNVVRVETGSPAYRAGLRTGDIVSCLSVRDNQLLFPRFGFNAYAPGMVIQLCVKRGAGWRSISFAPSAKPSYGLLYYTIPLTSVRLLVYGVFLITGIALVLARPTLLTALFYTYCIASGPSYVLTTYGTVWPAWFYSLVIPINLSITSLGVVALALFALCVPNHTVPSGWRRLAFFAICALAVVPLWNALAADAWTSVYVPGIGFLFIDEALTAIAVLIVIVRLFEVKGEERARLSWVVFALAWGAVMNSIRNNVGVHGTTWEHLSSVAADLTIVMPLVMLYAILKRHLIDVRFVISRTVVYACLTTLIVGVIGLVDWLTSAYLSQVRLAMAIDAAVTIGLAFVLHRVYGWVESAVDFMLFRRKHEAERYLERVARTLMFAEHEDAVDKALVHDPHDKLCLTAAVLYRAQGGAYVPTRVEGWNRACAPEFCADDDIVRFMLAERAKIALGDLRAHVAEPFRLQGHTPAVAIPVFQGNRLSGFAMYGIHRDGTKLDPDEIETLEHLCAAAAQAYTSIELARYQRAQERAMVPERGTAVSPA